MASRDPARIELTLRIRLCAAAFAGGIAAIVLFGWTTGHQDLARLAPGLGAMNPMTAMACLLAAFALTLPPRRPMFLLAILTIAIVSVGVTKLVQILLGLPFGIDQYLFADRLAGAGDIPASDMPAGVALALVLLGGGLLAGPSSHRRAGLATQFLCAVVMAIALFAAVGYGLDGLGLDGIIRIRMSFYSALALIALAIGVASIRSEAGMAGYLLDRGVAGSVARSTLPFVLLAAVIVGTEDGTALQVFTNLLATSAMLTACVLALLRADRARRRRELATERSESYYRHAEQVGHIGHWRVERSTGAIQWSDEVSAILGLPVGTIPSLEEELGRFHPDDWEGPRTLVEQSLRECRDWEIGHRFLRPTGEVRYVRSLGVCERDAQGEPEAMFGVIIDVTELEFARREAEAASASQAAFLANMSHEIRTPMNGVMGFVELLMDSNLDAKQRRHLLLVQESAQALLKLLNDILDLSKIEAGQLDLNAEPSDVRRDIKQCVRLMTPAAEQKGLALRATFADGFPDCVLIDSLRLRQILFNLLGNAVKFTEQGTVSVVLSEAAGPTGSRIILIKVADTGVGIADERKAAIFDAFVQADASTSRRFGGSGLGLSISRSLVALMGGTIALDSFENEGTLVTLALPLDEVAVPARAAVTPVRPGPAASAILAAPTRLQASILLVEDIDINQELITEMLTRLGHSVDLAGNGAEALAMAHRLELDPAAWDLIFMDVQMPVMDGLAATRAIRALGGRAATIPILALTANAFAIEMQQCRDSGMTDHIAKPSGFAELKQAVELWGGITPSSMPATGFRELETASSAERFQARLRKSGGRLAEIVAQLADAGDRHASALLREAAGLAHILAGTAGMFGKAGLGDLAAEVEREIKMIGQSEGDAKAGLAQAVIQGLIMAIGARPERSGSPQPSIA
jgi:PAS domain S-box-containing protein